jgi:prepilin-type processing-associated H-X9-DG protein
MYANDNKGKLPQHASGALWLWDVPFATRDAMVKPPRGRDGNTLHAGGARQVLYCPAFSEQNVDALWNFDSDKNGTPDFTVLGYVWLGFRPTAANPNVTSFPAMTIGNREYVRAVRPPRPPAGTTPPVAQAYPSKSSDVEVMADAVITGNVGPVVTVWSANGGWTDRHVTNHMRRNLPEGANILFLDWHVDFRPFQKGRTEVQAVKKESSEMQLRVIINSIGFFF